MEQIQYKYSEIEKIISTETFNLNNPTKDILIELSQLLGDVDFSENNKKCERKDDKNYKYKSRKNKYAKSPSINDVAEWEAIKNFKPTEKVVLSDIDNKIKEIRSDLNKLSKMNYEQQKSAIVDNIFSIFEGEKINSEDYSENQKKIGNMIFDTLSTNKFLSQIYADLYVELVGKSEYFGYILDNFIENYKNSLNNIQYIDPDKDYNGFCNYNQKNEIRKSNSIFLINLMKYNMITQDIVLDLICELQITSFQHIECENKTHEVEEITENLFILLTESKILLNNSEVWLNTIQPNIEKFSKLKAKEHPSLSSRCVFKFMDM